MHAPQREDHVADGELRHRDLVDPGRPPHALAVLLEDGGIDVVDAGRAQRDHLEAGERGAHALGEAVEPDHGGVIARKVVDQLVLGEGRRSLRSFVPG